jgi:hypothetical protein
VSLCAALFNDSLESKVRFLNGNDADMLDVKKKFLIIGLIFTLSVFFIVLTGNVQPKSFEISESKMLVNLVLVFLSALATGIVLYQHRNLEN